MNPPMEPLDAVNWDALRNNDDAIRILERSLERSPDRINWNHFMNNQNAIHILERSLVASKKFPKVVRILDESPYCILYDRFPYFRLEDYANLKTRKQLFAEELTKYVFNPKRLLRFCEKYEMDLYDYSEVMNF
jgi:hypothetical protein